MRLEQVAVQLFTIRDFVKTRQDFADSMQKIKEIGYSAIQLSAGSLAAVTEAEFGEILADTGLICCSTHEDGHTILNQPELIAEKMHRLGCKYTAYPYPAGVKLDTSEDIEAFAAALNRAGQVLAEAGITLVYHNHAIEFRRYNNKTMLEIIYQKTDQDYVQGEIDTYWVQYGGGDPVEWCRRLDQRLPLLHLKDYAINAKYQPTFAEIGQGNLDFKQIVQAAETAGCRWFIVEQDKCEGDPFSSLAISFDYMQNLAEK